jgi:hypothetical protein
MGRKPASIVAALLPNCGYLVIAFYGQVGHGGVL